MTDNRPTARQLRAAAAQGGIILCKNLSGIDIFDRIVEDLLQDSRGSGETGQNTGGNL